MKKKLLVFGILGILIAAIIATAYMEEVIKNEKIKNDGKKEFNQTPKESGAKVTAVVKDGKVIDMDELNVMALIINK